jgi:hypothetical protein
MWHIKQSVRGEGTRCGQISSWRGSPLPPKIPLGAARLIPENSDSAPGCHIFLRTTLCGK